MLETRQTIPRGMGENEAQIRVALAHAPIVLFSQDRDLRYAWVLSQFPGLLPEELIGKRDDEVFLQDEADRLTRIKQRVMETGENAREEVTVTIRKRRHFFDLIAEPLRGEDGDISGVMGVAISVTERKEAEQALATSEERYRAVSEILFGYVYSYRVESDFKMVLEWLSGAFEGVTGRTLEEANARSGWTMAINPADHDIIREKVRTLLAGGEDVSEYRIFTKQGETRWVRDFSRPVKDETGRVVRIYGAIQDITERKEAVDALRESEDRFRRLAGAAVEGIVIHEKGIIIDANESYANLLGYPLSELIGKPIESLVAPESRETVMQHIREGSEEPYEAKSVRRDGTIVVHETAGKMMPWHGHEARVTSIRDLTGLRRVESALRESEDRYRSFFTNDISGDFIAAPDGTIILCNPSFAAIFGFESPESAVGRKLSEAYTEPEKWDEFIADLCARGRLERYEGERRSLDGRIIQVMGNAVARYDERGEFTEIAGYIYDITEQRQAEKALKESEERFRRLAGATVEGIVIHEGGIILDANESLATLLGYPLSELIGKPIESFIVSGSRETVMQHIREKSEEQYEVNGARPDGTVVVYEISGKTIPWNGREVRVASVRDITSLRQAEKALRESEERYRSLFMNDLAGTYVAAPDSTIILCNPSFAAIFGFESPESAVGQRLTDLYTESGKWETFLADLRVRGRLENYGGERRSIDGRIIQTIGNAVARYDERGELAEVAGYIFDITERTLNADRMETLLTLNQMTERPLEEITNFALEEAVRLTRSKIGYLALMNDDETVMTMYSWSKEAMRECAIDNKPIHYTVDTMGLWGEAVRQRRPIITNDYAAPNPLKRGYPEGHIAIHRHMNAPVISAGRIVLVAGVANKEKEYDDSDVRQLTLLMEGMWNLTERKRTLDALRAGEEKFRIVLENSLDAAYRRDLQTDRYDYISPAIERITGLTGQEFAALSIGEVLDRVHPDDLGMVTEEMGAVSSGERNRGIIEYRFRGKDGEYRWLADSFTVVRDEDGIPEFRVGVMRDITRQRNAEESLRESEARFRTLADASDEGVVIYERETVLDVNRRFAEIFGYERDETAGMYLGDFFPPDYREQAIQALRRESDRSYETVGERKDGARVPMEIHGRAIPWYGRTVRVVSVRDVSARKEMERNIVRLRREYESFMRHELKNLFIPIQMHASVLLEDAEEQFTPEQRLSLRRIRESAERASGVIDALKRIQDIEEGRYTLRLIRCSIRKLVREVVRDMRPVADRNGVTLLYTARGNRTEVFADKDLLPGVFANLILNAIEHVAENSDPEEKVVRITIGSETGRVVVRINNRGEPIPPERLDTFFERFNVGPEKRQGLGLGTTYAWLVTRAHGGEITVTSNHEEGTTVTVTLRPAGKTGQ